MSPRIEALLGFTPDEWQADRELWVKLLHHEDRERVLAEANLTATTGRPFETEYRLLTRDGRTVWIRDEVVIVRDEESRLQHWQGIMADISERKRAEEALELSETRLRTLIEQSPWLSTSSRPTGSLCCPIALGKKSGTRVKRWPRREQTSSKTTNFALRGWHHILRRASPVVLR